MVLIHGGDYISGSHAKIDASRLGEVKDIVLVSFNYRIGILGS